MLFERKRVKVSDTLAVRKVARRLSESRAVGVKRLRAVLIKSDDSSVTLAITKIGARYGKMLNLLSR